MTTAARYDAVAGFYEQFAPDTYEDSPTAALLELVGDAKGLRLLDLACGHGRLARELARRGANVVGVDISARLLDLARARQAERPQHIAYVLSDVATPGALPGEAFDGITCSFGLSDIDDLDGALATVARVLRADGFFAFSVLHPCFPGWKSKQASPSWDPERGYYQEGWWRAPGPAHGVRPKVGANHRMLSTYLNALAHHGLVVEQTVEPSPPSDWLADPPPGGLVPVYLVALCRRSGGSTHENS